MVTIVAVLGFVYIGANAKTKVTSSLMVLALSEINVQTDANESLTLRREQGFILAIQTIINQNLNLTRLTIVSSSSGWTFAVVVVGTIHTCSTPLTWV